MIKNLHPSTPKTEIIEEIEKTGNKIRGEIIIARYDPNKIPLSTFFVNLEPSPNNSLVKDIKYIFHTRIKIEDPKKKNHITQCHRCQQYGHTKNNCMRPYRCVKCAQGHRTSDCPKVDKNTPAKCALCLGDHPANFKGCKVYIEIKERRNPRQDKRHLTNIDNINTAILCHPAVTPSITTTQSPRPKQPKYISYAEAAKYTTPNSADYERKPSQKLEIILERQMEKIDFLIQHIGSLVELIATLISRLHS